MDYKLYSKIFYIWLSQWCLFCKNSTGYHYWSSNEGELGRERVQVIKAITAEGDFCHEIKTLALWKKSYEKPRQHIKKQRYHFANKVACSQTYGFSSSYVLMWALDHKEGWAQKNCCFWTVLEKTLESPLNCKEIRPTLDLSQKAKEW